MSPHFIKLFEEHSKKFSLDDIHNKYYKDIDFNIFKQIIEADPTSHRKNGLFFGKYCKWLLRLYKQNKLKLEDLYKATEYLQIFDRQSVKNRLPIKDILKFSSLSELAKLIDPYKDKEEILSDEERKEKNLVAEFKNFKLYIPRTYEDSCLLGKGTEWCTATEKTREYFDEYHKKDDELFIFISKKDPKEKYQLHFGSEQFMNRYDERENFVDFLNDNKDIKDYFFNNEKYGYLVKYWVKIEEIKTKNIEIDDLTFFEFDENKKYKKIDVSYLNIKSLKGSPRRCEEFICGYNNLISLEGSPEECDIFYCDNNEKLKSLKGVPKKCKILDCSSCDLTSLDSAPKECDEFYCYGNINLKSLKGAPKKCIKFDCSYCDLISLEGSPEECDEFYCYNNKNLRSLKGSPIKCKKFDCSNCDLISIEGVPKSCEIFRCYNNINLKSLKGAPRKCEKFVCSNCDLISLEGSPEECDEFYCYDNKNLTSLKGCPRKCKYFDCSNCNLTDLNGAPEYIEENFECSDNNIKTFRNTTLKYIGGDFICNKNKYKLSKKEIEWLKNNVDIKGEIIIS